MAKLTAYDLVLFSFYDKTLYLRMRKKLIEMAVKRGHLKLDDDAEENPK